jgi:putative transposase
MYLPGVPSHVVQRGNNRDVCFYCDDDYQFYLECLKQAARKYGVSIHAYVLMTNHVHLLLTPAQTESISRAMQSIGRRYVQYINFTYRRSGTLWEGRHKASLVDAESYLLSCYRYIELNPVRAGMVEHPGDYRWSSYRHHAYDEKNALISDHELFRRLGLNAEERRHHYRMLFNVDLDKDLLHTIRTAANFSMPLGNDRFKAQIEQALGRSVGQARRGKPVTQQKTTKVGDEN